MKTTNHFDNNGNYINVENLSLAEIYLRASEEGYKRGFLDASLGIDRKDEISKMTDDYFAKLMGGGV